MTVNAPITHSSSGIFNQDGTLTVNFENRNPVLPGDLIILSSQATFNIRGRLIVNGTVYDPGGDLIISRELALPLLLSLLLS